MLNSKAISWTLFVRLTHWLVATCVVINFYKESGFWHRAIGYSGFGLVLLRITYGMWFSKAPCAKLYVPSLASIKTHISRTVAREVDAHTGHNPLGQCAVYAMWLLIMLLTLTGWLSRTDQYWGEDWPVDLHVIFSNMLQGLVVLHLLAVMVMSKLQGKNLVKAMIHEKQTIVNQPD